MRRFAPECPASTNPEKQYASAGKNPREPVFQLQSKGRRWGLDHRGGRRGDRHRRMFFAISLFPKTRKVLSFPSTSQIYFLKWNI